MSVFEAWILAVFMFALGIDVGMSDWWDRLLRVRIFRPSDWREFFRGR